MTLVYYKIEDKVNKCSTKFLSEVCTSISVRHISDMGNFRNTCPS